VDRLDRVGSRSPQQEVEQRDQIVEYSDLARQYGPEPSDGEVLSRSIPSDYNFLLTLVVDVLT